MPRTLLLLTLITAMLISSGCSHNYFNIPRETYEQKVRILGVAPIFMDGDSDIRHPERETLVALIKDFNRKNEPELVAAIKESASHFSVNLLPDDPDKLFSSIFFRREKRDDAGIVYNKYFYKGPEVRDLISRNNVDALLLLVVSGLTEHENVYSSNLLSKLESDYNYLTISAQIIDPVGNILWEFPNFRQRRLAYPKFIALQYPDFDEARANETDKVEVKFKTIPGLNRLLAKTAPSPLRKNASVSEVYSTIFDDMVSMLRKPSNPFSFEKKQKPSPETQPTSSSQGKVNNSPVQQAKPQQSTPAPAPKTLSPEPPVQPKPAPAPVNIPAPAGSPPAESVSSPTIAPAN